MAEEVSHMLHEERTKKREQISLVCIDELVPKNHLLRKIDRVMTGHSYFPCSAPPFACGKSCSFLCHLKLTSKPAFLQTGWGTAYYPFVFRKEFAVKKEGSPVFYVSACLCFLFACIFQPVASFAGSSGLRRPEKWALMACFSHAAEVCYT